MTKKRADSSDLRSGHAIEVGVLFIDPVTGDIAGPGGSIRVDPIVMDVLVLLARHLDEVVPRERMMSTIWHDVVVTDHVLSRCIYELRGALAKASGDGTYREIVETLPKRGYRLKKPPVAAAVVKPTTRERPPWWLMPVGLIAAASAVVVLVMMTIREPRDAGSHDGSSAPVHSIAVLPFADMSVNQDQAYFADGIAEETLHLLAQFPELRVIARTSSFQFRGHNADIRAIRERLNVDYVLEGSIRRSEGRVKVTAQLIDAHTESHLWSGSFERAGSDSFAVQSEIAREVATTLSLLEQPNLPVGPATEPAVLDSIYRGRFLASRRGPGDLTEAERQFRLAIEMAPDFAPGWTGLAGVYSLQPGLRYIPEDEGARQLRLSIEQALALDPDNAEALLRAAQYAYRTGDRVAAENYFSRAEAVDPDHPLLLGFASNYYSNLGEYQKSIDVTRRAMFADPLGAVNWFNLTAFLAANGQYEEALQELFEFRQFFPTAIYADYVLACLLVLTGDMEAAGVAIESLPEGIERDQGIALLSGVDGYRDQAERALQRLAQNGDAMSAVRVAEVYAFRGETDAAFRWINMALIHEPDPATNAPPSKALDEIVISPFFPALRSDPRWQQSVAVRIQD